MGLPAYHLPEAATPVSPEDYLRLESESNHKHEYLNGRVVAIAGASFAHNLICSNALVSLGGSLRGSSCILLGSDQRVHVKNRASYLYPDVSVVCGKPEFLENKTPDTLLNPVLLIEVLSASTADNDRGAKFMLYRQLPSLRQYLILDAESIHAELYSLDELSRWVLTKTRDPQAVLDLGSIGCQVPLAEVYAGVALGLVAE